MTVYSTSCVNNRDERGLYKQQGITSDGRGDVGLILARGFTTSDRYATSQLNETLHQGTLLSILQFRLPSCHLHIRKLR